RCHMIEHVTCATADQLQCALREDSAGDYFLHHCFGEVRGYCCGFNHSRHSCQEVNGNLLQHSPHREIVCIDVNGNAFLRNKHVCANESIILTQIVCFAIYSIHLIRKLSSE